MDRETRYALSESPLISGDFSLDHVACFEPSYLTISLFVQFHSNALNLNHTTFI